MKPATTGIACGVLLAVVAASGQGVAAYGAPSRTLTQAQGVAAEQSASGLAGLALGLAAGETLVVKDVLTDTDGSTHVRYDRTFSGLRVIGGDLVSHRGQTGQIESVDWNSRKVAVASMTPKVGLASAKARGAKTASVENKTTTVSKDSKGELVVYAGGATPTLAYDVLTEGFQPDQTPSRLHTIVDANSGATLATWDEIQTGEGRGLFVGAVPLGTAAGITSAAGFSLLDTVGNLTTDMRGSTSNFATGATFTDADDLWGNNLVSDRASAAVDAHYGAGKTFEYFKTLGRNGIWNTGVGARSRVHYGFNYVNAFWDGSQMTYGDGAGNTHPLVALDVAGHEMSHGVTQNTAGLVYTGDAGGLNEATSDIFGAAVEFFANNLAETPDYLIGERLNLNGNGTPVRYMDKPSRDRASPDCWSSSVRLLDPHLSSGPLNHWFYLASEGSGAKVVNGVSYNSPTCNLLPVAPIGRDQAAKIWYRALSVYLTSNSTYPAAREAAIKSAKDLYGIGSLQCQGVAASFSAIAVPAGLAKC